MSTAVNSGVTSRNKNKPKPAAGRCCDDGIVVFERSKSEPIIIGESLLIIAEPPELTRSRSSCASDCATPTRMSKQHDFFRVGESISDDGDEEACHDKIERAEDMTISSSSSSSESDLSSPGSTPSLLLLSTEELQDMMEQQGAEHALEAELDKEQQAEDALRDTNIVVIAAGIRMDSDEEDEATTTTVTTTSSNVVAIVSVVELELNAAIVTNNLPQKKDGEDDINILANNDDRENTSNLPFVSHSQSSLHPMVQLLIGGSGLCSDDEVIESDDEDNNEEDGSDGKSDEDNDDDDDGWDCLEEEEMGGNFSSDQWMCEFDRYQAEDDYHRNRGRSAVSAAVQAAIGNSPLVAAEQPCRRLGTISYNKRDGSIVIASQTSLGNILYAGGHYDGVAAWLESCFRVVV